MSVALPAQVGLDVSAPALAPLHIDAVLKEHGELIARWTTRLAGPGVDVDDALQEVLLQVHRSLRSFEGRSKLTTWLYQLTRQVMLRWRRRERFRQWLLGAPDDVDPEATAAGPAALVERREASALLYKALEALNEKQRTALLLHEMEHLTAEEIGEIMGAKPGTVWVWLHRGRATLRRRVAELEGRP